MYTSSTVTNHLSSFSSATPELTPDAGQWVFREWGFPNLKTARGWAPQSCQQSCSQPLLMPARESHTLLAWRADSQGGAGALLSWCMQEAWHWKWWSLPREHASCSSTAGLTLPWLPRSHGATGQSCCRFRSSRTKHGCSKAPSSGKQTVLCPTHQRVSHAHVYEEGFDFTYVRVQGEFLSQPPTRICFVYLSH